MRGDRLFPELNPDRIRARITGLRRWPRRGLLFGLGALGALAHAPFFLFPALAIGLTALVWSLDGARREARPARAGFGRAFTFALGYFAAGVFWIAFAFFSRGAAFAPFGPVAALAAAVLLALYWGLAGALQARIGGRSAVRVAVFALLIFGAEWLRGHVLAEFPWNLPAYVWVGGGAISQSAALFGAWGLSLITLLAFTAPATLAGPRAMPGRLAPVLAALLVFAGLTAWGAQRLSSAGDDTMPGVRVRLVQVTMSQREKWTEGNEALVRARYLDAMSAPGLEQVSHVIWPEGALPVYLLEDGETLDHIGRRLADGPVLVTGTPRREEDEDGRERYYNSVAALRFPGGRPQLTHLYDKVRLVPFGEYIPLAPVFRAFGIETLSDMVDGYSRGPGPDVFNFSAGPPAAILVCYEIVYPRFAPSGRARPAWIINVSNDAWFGSTAGPAQHLNIARYRAIESGLPVVRAASGGYSGAISPFGLSGRIIGPQAEGAHDLTVPAPLPPTFYSRHGNGIWAAFLFVVVLIVASCKRDAFSVVWMGKPRH